jgi:hypothetical protein
VSKYEVDVVGASMTFVPGQACPCGCGVTGSKLSFKTGHIVRLCGCSSCRNSRNVKRGKRAQAKGHKALGGVGFTPGNEESTNGYDVRCQVEHKAGAQVPQNFRAFIAGEWFRHALSQADRARRVGDGSMPAVMIDGRWIVVDAKRDQGTPA